MDRIDLDKILYDYKMEGQCSICKSHYCPNKDYCIDEDILY